MMKCGSSGPDCCRADAGDSGRCGSGVRRGRRGRLVLVQGAGPVVRGAGLPPGAVEGRRHVLRRRRRRVRHERRPPRQPPVVGQRRRGRVPLQGSGAPSLPSPPFPPPQLNLQTFRLR